MATDKNKIRKYKKWILTGALVFFALQLAIPALLMPYQAKAVFGVGDISITAGDIPREISEIISKALKTAADVAFKNVLRNYLNNLAYNFAVDVATGSPGQKPLFPTKPQDLLEQAADAAAGDFLDGLAQSWTKGTCQGFPDQECFKDSECPQSVYMCPDSAYGASSSLDVLGCVPVTNASNEQIDRLVAQGLPAGYDYFDFEGPPTCLKNFSLCEPRDLTTKINIQLMAEQYLGGTKAQITTKCSLTDILDNYEELDITDDIERLGEKGFGETAGDILAGRKDRIFLAELSKSFNPEDTEFGAYVEIISNAREEEETAKEKEAFKKSQEGELNAPETKVSEEKKTPAAFVEDTQSVIVSKSIDQYLVQTGSAIADAVGVFTNTLTSKLLDRLVNEGWNPFVSNRGSTSGSGNFFQNLFGGSSPGITAAKLLFSDIQKTDYIVGGEVDILSQLASCPDSTDPTPSTCVMDNRLRAAVEQELTVQEALDQGLLEGSKPLGFYGDGSQPEYYNGYPYRSLVILRKYRILPVGWELAAKYIRDYAQQTFSLSQVIAEYDNIDSPFYKLVNPNWVLKSPELYCRREGSGPKMLTEQAVRNEDTNDDNKIDIKDAATTLIQRDNNYCADEQMCLLETSDGSCAKFGYCIEEEPIWKFNGTSCEPEYNTCELYQDPAGNQAAYLANTLDSEECNAANAGCQWYCKDWDATAEAWTCDASTPIDGDDTKISFNAKAEACDQTAEGCHQYVSYADSGANAMLNTGFEQVTAGYGGNGQRDDGIPDKYNFNWYIQGETGPDCGQVVYADSDAHTGFTSGRLSRFGADCAPKAYDIISGGHSIAQPLITGYPTDGRSFTLSFYAKKDDPTCAGGDLNFGVYRPIQANYGMTFPDGLEYSQLDVHETTVTVGDSWTRYTSTFNFQSIPANAWELMVYGTIGDPYFLMTALLPMFSLQDSCEVLIDDVQLEEGSVTNYNTYEDNPKTYIKKAPSYLGCDANPDQDACEPYALSCSLSEVGCELYTSQTDGQSVPGVISNPASCVSGDPASCDQCPSEYVGCEAFRELPIERMPYRPARDPVSFMPDSGQSCPASAVGCEEYTNMAAAGQGGESREYYSYIRMCVEDTDVDTGTFYTWEGSEEYGYQLKSYFLKVSNHDPDGDGNFGPCTNVPAEGDDIILNQLGVDWPTCIDNTSVDRDGDGVDDEFFDYASCTAADVGQNPDCTEFYDSSGNTHYMLKSQLVYASDNCQVYRNSVDTAAGNDVLYHMVPGQSVSCASQYAGCRAYKGNAGDNIRSVYATTFESGTTSPWVGGTYSNESTYVGGHSMLVNPATEIPNIGADYDVPADTSYTVSFWAKGASADTTVSFAFATADPLIFPGQAPARADSWNRFELGPLTVPAGTDLTTVPLRVYGTSAFYIDTIELNQVSDSIYRIKDSYTDCSGYEGCDQYQDRSQQTHYLKSFTRLCRDDHVGCELMIDTQNTDTVNYVTYPLVEVPWRTVGDINLDGSVDMSDSVAIKDCIINNNCPEPIQVADPNNDGQVNQADWQYIIEYASAGGPPPRPRYVYDTNNNSVLSDSFVALVNDQDKHCSSADEGCVRYGLPSLDADGNVSSFDDIYIKDQPDNYGEILCLFNESGCQEYTTSTGAKSYFRDPGANICNYTKIPGQDVSGWYQLGTTEGAPNCPVMTGICIRGQNQGQPCSTGDECDEWPGWGICSARENIVAQPAQGWTGLCGTDAAGCTEYRDPEDPIDTTDPENPVYCDVSLADGGGNGTSTFDCKSYYYLADTTDNSSCNGLINRPSGCLLFYDTSGSDPNYDSRDTENNESPSLCTVPYGEQYLRGDVDFNGGLDGSDLQYLLDYLNGQEIAPDPLEVADVNNDGNVNVDDHAYLDSYLNGVPPGPAPDPEYVTSDCNANTVLQVKPDRVCDKWLECGSSWQVKNANGKVESLCSSRYLCDAMDPQTGACTKRLDFDDYSYVNQTFTSPNFASEVENLTGMVVAGLDWSKRCTGNPDISCEVDADCAGNGECSDPQIIEGYYPYQSMRQRGSVTPAGSIIEYGDFGDSDYFKNAALTEELSSVDADGEPDGPREINFEQLSAEQNVGDWEARQNAGKAAEIFLTEEASNGLIPSPNNNFDENNVAHIATAGAFTGITYDLGRNVFQGEEYVVSFRMKSGQLFREDDEVLVQLEYKTSGNPIYQTLDTIVPTLEWQTFALGPVVGGYDENNQPFGYSETKLNIVYNRTTGTPFSTLDMYIDDVSMKPILEIQEQKCYGGTEDGNVCTADADCPGGECFTRNDVARDCRLYPNAQAPYCTYTDENNTTYKGWYGYCVERDPDNPKYCLNWWPVDLLYGEEDIFGDLKTTTYDQRRPLYYCVQSRGNAKPMVDVEYNDYYSWGTQYNPGPETGEGYYVLPDVNQIRKRTIYIDYYVNGFVVKSHADVACQPDGATEPPGGAPIPVCDWGGYEEVVDLTVTSTNIFEKDIERIDFTWEYDDGFGWGDFTGYFTPETMTAQGYRCNENSAPFKCGPVAAPSWVDRVIDTNPAPNEIIWRVYPTVNCHGSAGYQCMYLNIYFDESTGRLLRIRTIGEDATGSNDEEGAFQLHFYMKEPCTNIVKTANLTEQPIIFSSRVNSGTAHEVNNLQYEYIQNYKPFGGIVNPGEKQGVNENDPNTWPLINAEQRSIELTTNYAHSGSPYSCDADCSERGCSWDKDNKCRTSTEIERCITHTVNGEDQNNGVCKGLGTGFCSENKTLRCASDSDCPGTGNTCNTSMAGIWASNNTTNNATYHLSRLFAYPLSGWFWDNSTAVYHEYDLYDPNNPPSSYSWLQTWQKDYHDMEMCLAASKCGANERCDYPNDYCGVLPTVSDIMVGTTQENMVNAPATVDLSGGNEVHLSFNINADPDQKPIKYIEVDWGETAYPSYFTLQGNYDSNTVYLTHAYNMATNPPGSNIEIKIIDNWDWCGVKAGESCGGDCRYSVDGSDCDSIDTGINFTY